MAARMAAGTEGGARVPWREVLGWFMRAVAVMWLAKGLIHWSLVLGVGDTARSHFADMPAFTQGASVAFAVLDLVAAVGLWLVSAWGGVIWAAAAAAHAAIDLVRPDVFGRQGSFVMAVGALLLTYLVLASLASRERARPSRPR